MKIDVKMSRRVVNILNILGISVLFGLGVFAHSRISFLDGDMVNHIMVWYDFIHTEGILKALRVPFSNYTPLYTYLLALSTVTYSYLDKVIAIKMIPITADVVSAFLVYKIVRLKYLSGWVPFWAAGVFFCLPTVFANSAIWGQIDSLYTVFLVASLYFLLKDQPFWGMLAFAFAFSVKLQSIVFIPFLIVLLFKKRVQWWHFILIPVIYTLLCVPVVLLGRGKRDVLSIYLGQIELLPRLSANAPNLYGFIPDEFYYPAIYIGLALAVLGIGAWIVFSIRSRLPLNRDRLVLIGFISALLTPFLLPRMHERYFYPADVFALITAFFLPEMWFVVLAAQISSGLVYWRYFHYGPSLTNVYLGAFVNAALIVYLLWKQFSPRPDQDTQLLPNPDLGTNNIL